VEFVTFWSWKLPFQRYLQHFWEFATRVHLGCFRVSLGVWFCFKF
jgi:hypothetical protein